MLYVHACVVFEDPHFSLNIADNHFLAQRQPIISRCVQYFIVVRVKKEKLTHCIKMSSGVINFYDVHYIADIILLYPFFFNLSHPLLLMIKLVIFYIIIVVLKESHEEAETTMILLTSSAYVVKGHGFSVT